ncbi:CaiB/BaiF CoA transferase family protein [Paraburkholderia saeva]|uniref:Acetyl-CoA:oxalate CoA-transferase n=1 Tax=Paraburkholderia saeva TaxID=2777537 RepID=A0A9N8RSK1_9BURK|nr:CoA transferase [Paraburkholderia saeva]CAG4886774.1 Acetyl-CoA:oxalate CoA-transferase [Paraburkholderia saeva]CAG4887195.1 Acetyl-CoA:oxalate CoA-transferase [Paraburkholderia saeva]
MSHDQQSTRENAPLKGLRVVEFGQYIAVPACGQTMAELGADVIKVEPPEGDAGRYAGWNKDQFGPLFSAWNRSKRSVVLDLRDPEGRRNAFALACTADVVLQNYRPGVMEKLGLHAAALTSTVPRLVYGQVSGFGQTGPASQRAGFDIAAQAESGMMSINGDGDRDPTRVGFTVVDVMAANALTSGVFAALLRRSVSGEGGIVDVSLVDVAVSALSSTWAEYRLNGVVPVRSGNGQTNATPAAEVMPTVDGNVVISAYTKEHFARLCGALDRPDIAADPRFCENAARLKNRHAMLIDLRHATSQFSTADLCERLTRAGVVFGQVRTMAEVTPGEAGVSADLFVQVHASGRGPVSLPACPTTFHDYHRRDGRLPDIGEHTAEVLADLSLKNPDSARNEQTRTQHNGETAVPGR